MATSPATVSALLELQEKLDDVTRASARETLAAGRGRFDAIRAAVYDRRKELVSGVRYFWLKALINHPAFSLFVTAADSRMLRFLVDIDVAPVPKAAHPSDFEIVFTFAENDFFEDQCLVKRYSHSDQRGRIVGTHDIRWKGNARDLVARKGRGGISQSAFFRWIAHDTTDASSFGDLIKQQLYPHAIELFFGTYTLAHQPFSYHHHFDHY